MASPEQVTIHNLTGNWSLNRTLSDNLEAALAIQGIPFLVRKLMRVADVYETVTETTNTDGTKGLIVTKSVASVKGLADTFDGSGEEIFVDGKYFGPKVRERSWWVDLSSGLEPKQPTGEPLDGYLLKDWIQEEAKGVPGHFAAKGINETSGGKDNMMWGFCLIGGKRYRAVKYYIRKGEREVRARLVFNWIG